MSHYEIQRLPPNEHSALSGAVALGAFASRQDALRTLIASNRGHQIADTYERELDALERAALALLAAKYVD